MPAEQIPFVANIAFNLPFITTLLCRWTSGSILEKKYRKRGPEKNHRPDPIVHMGLLIDRDGLPLTYTLYPGNESEKVHMLPAIERARVTAMISRVINVADRGLNTSENIWHLAGDNTSDNPEAMDGYVFGKSVRGADKEFKTWVLNQEGYKTVLIDQDLVFSDDEDHVENQKDKIRFVYKIRNIPVTLNIHVDMPDGTVKIVHPRTDQRQLVYYSEKYARKQKFERDRMVERARDLIAHPKKYDRVTAAGAASYVQNISFRKDTGEIIEKELSLDLEKIAEEEKYDGYYAIVTSELNMEALEIRNIYRGLIRIEHTFRITKSQMKARPAYVWTTDHIKAHFGTCFASLCLLKFLMKQLDGCYTAEQILDSLKRYNCVDIDHTYWQFVYYDEIIEKISGLIGAPLNLKRRTKNEIRRLLKY